MARKPKEPFKVNYERITVHKEDIHYVDVDGMTPATLQELFDKYQNYSNLKLITCFDGYDGAFSVYLAGDREENDVEYTARIEQEVKLLKNEEAKLVSQAEKDLAEFKRLQQKLKKQGLV